MNGQRRTWAHENEIRAWHDTHYAHTSPETKRSAWQHFANLQDPYNTGNFMTGWVQMIGGDEYGNLLIEEINERPAPQRITATTPKTSYPYRRDRAWLMNQSQWVRTALKYDGTNICQYSYRDAGGNRFTTFKLRTRPFVPAHFRVMLDRSLRKYPGVAGLSLEPGEAMVYELYGRQNPMLIAYREEIELTALFRRNPDTGDIDPADPEGPASHAWNAPCRQQIRPNSGRTPGRNTRGGRRSTAPGCARPRSAGKRHSKGMRARCSTSASRRGEDQGRDLHPADKAQAAGD